MTRRSTAPRRDRRRVVSPLAGKPRTRERRLRDGTRTYTILPRVLTARRVRRAEFLGSVSGLGLGACGFMTSAAAAMPGLFIIGAFVIPLMLIPVFTRMWKGVLRKTVKLAFTLEVISVPRFLGKRRFDRTIPHSFIMRPHDRAEEEAEKVRYEERRGDLRRHRKYYRDSWIIALWDGAQAYPLLEVHGKAEAEKIFGRIQYVDRLVEQVVTKDTTDLPGPDAEWDDLTGRIPENL